MLRDVLFAAWKELLHVNVQNCNAMMEFLHFKFILLHLLHVTPYLVINLSKLVKPVLLMGDGRKHFALSGRWIIFPAPRRRRTGCLYNIHGNMKTQPHISVFK